MKWNPDPCWPKHIIGLCEAIANGDDVRPMLHDALLEEGLPKCAERSLHDSIGMLPGDLHWVQSVPVGFILRDGYVCAGGGKMQDELTEYIKRRRTFMAT